MRWRRAVASICLVALATGCERTFQFYDCEDPCETCLEPCPKCDGECVPLPPLEFNGPALLWIGKEADAPQCPDRAPQPIYEGHAGLDDSNQCSPCECTQPRCVLPSGVTASPSTCSNGPGVPTAFDAPAGWDGSCTSPTPVDQLGSITIAPLTIAPCLPVVDHVTIKDLYAGSTWATFARACTGLVYEGACANAGERCVPTAEPPPPGFRQCLLYLPSDEAVCPTDYPEKHTFFRGLEDTRACTACECTPIFPSHCAASLSAYTDASCMTGLVSALMGADASQCHDVMPGAQIASMKATWTLDDPGTCAPMGGFPTGTAIPTTPRTFCCQPPP